MAKGGYAPVNGLELHHKVRGEGDDFLPEERPEGVTAAIGDPLGARSRP